MSADKELGFSLQVSGDSLAVSLDCTVDEAAFEGLVAAVLGELEAVGITERPSYAELTALLEDAASQGSEVKGLVLARGKAPVPPTHGRIEWARDFFSQAFVVNEETGVIDYRAHVGQPCVEAGELLAHVFPPAPGVNGKNVYGKELKAPKARPARIKPGTGVVAGAEQGDLCAEDSGRVRFRGGVLSVDNIFVIEGSVGLESGNIDHNGAVLVRGDLEAGAEIRATGDIEIEGAIESADVDAGGDLKVGRGITGHGKQPIRAGGNVEARFVAETALEVGGDLLVHREMVNSKVQARGTCFVPRGRMVGGEVRTYGNIYAHQAGSVGHVKTFLRILQDEELAEARVHVEQQIKDVKQRLAKIAGTLAPVRDRAASLKGEAREAVAQLIAASQEMNKDLETLNAELAEINAKSESRGRPQIIFRDTVFPETMLEIHGERLGVKEEYKGPIRALSGRDGIFFQPISKE